MTNKQFAVVGKVINGRVTVTVATASKVVGYSKPVTRTKVEETTTGYTVVHPPVQHESIDSPFISMVNRHHRKVQQEKEQRLTNLYKPQSTTFKDILKSFIK